MFLRASVCARACLLLSLLGGSLQTVFVCVCDCCENSLLSSCVVCLCMASVWVQFLRAGCVAPQSLKALLLATLNLMLLSWCLFQELSNCGLGIEGTSARLWLYFTVGAVHSQEENLTMTVKTCLKLLYLFWWSRQVKLIVKLLIFFKLCGEIMCITLQKRSVIRDRMSQVQENYSV